MKKIAIIGLLLVPCLAGADVSVQGGRTKAETPPARQWTIPFSPKAHSPIYRVSSFLLDPHTVVDPSDGSIRLAHSTLLADETGATDYKQTESLPKNMQVKKVFVLDDDEVTTAEILFYGSAAKVTVNGKSMPAPKRLVSTGWSRLAISPANLKKGKNVIVFHGPGQLLVEPGRPGKSFKSTDGGKTWSRGGLTSLANQQGEYLVRLRLGRYAPVGSATSQVIELWRIGKSEVPLSLHIRRLSLNANLGKHQPDGTTLKCFVRTGSRPAPGGKNWTNWIPLEKSFRPEGKAQTHRWAQLKFLLETHKPQETPRVPASFALVIEGEPQFSGSSQYAIVNKKTSAVPLRGSVPFVYQKVSPRLKLLRERYKLDQVIAPGKTELEKLMLLRHWVRNQWHTAWQGNSDSWMPAWDAHIILENRDQRDCLTMCTHYAAVFTQCCLALGWNARHCILDHHCVSEVYIQEFDKWVMMDAGNSAKRADVTLHFEKNRVPMSARELHLAYRSGKTDGIEVCFTPQKLMAKIATLCRPAPKRKESHTARPDRIALKDLKEYPVCQLENYRRYAFPPRNNYLQTLLPGELYQGWSSYFYDGYEWVGDSPDQPAVSPEYSFHLAPQRPQDVDWKLNWTRIYLSQTKVPGRLRVDLETLTPNFAGFQAKITNTKQKSRASTRKCPRSFVWKLSPGENTLTVWSVNHWNRNGTPARISVNWKPKK